MIEELNAMSDFDLVKKFTSSFLHVHGKLFSKIGMDLFAEAAKQMMIELKCLLRRPLGIGGGARYLQLLAICIFSVANNSLKSECRLFYLFKSCCCSFTAKLPDDLLRCRVF